MTATPSNDAALQGNYDVDYVIRYTFGGTGKCDALVAYGNRTNIRVIMV
jgi:hypothetical protein